ncbi:hypothetical protein JCM5350_007256 [Sporobolomyces pararoseus]
MSYSQGGRRLPPPPPPPPPPVPAPASAQTPLAQPSQQLQPGAASQQLAVRNGTPLNGIKVNTFQVGLPQTDQTWWKYEVVIATAARTKPDGTAVPSKPIPKQLLWKVFAEIQWTHGERFGGLQPAFDGGNAIYTNRQLPSSPLVIQDIKLADGKKGSFTATFKNPVPIPLDGLRSYISGRGQAHVGDVFEALQALNVLFRHTPSLLFSSTRTSFFPMSEVNPGTTVKLVGGICLWRGFFQSIRPCAIGLQLNLDTTSGAYVQSGNLIELLLAAISPNAKIGDLDLSRGRLQGTSLIMLNRLLRRVRVTVVRGRQVPPGKERYLKMEIKGGGLKLFSARSHRFDVNGRQTDVEEFFLTTYGTRLQYPNFPLLEVKNGVLVPIELVTVDPGAKWAHRLSPQQTGAASNFQILKPGERLRQILLMRQKVLQQQSQLHLDSFGVSLAPQATQVPARLLYPPRIEYQSEKPRDRRPGVPPRFVSARVENGGWKQNKQGPTVREKFVTANTELESAVVILSNQNMLRDGPKWFQSFFKWCSEMGLRIHPAVAGARQGLFFTKNSHDVNTTVTSAIRQAENNFGKNPQVIFWLFDSERSEDYDKFKYETISRGLASQALVYNKIANKANDFTFHLNCALKLNVKLSGFNFRLERNAPGRENFMQSQTPMVFGADLSHQLDKPSIAVVTASMHEQGVLHEEQISIQPLLEPPPFAPPTARAKKQEIIVDLEQMVFELLCRRALSQLKCPPQAIVFFRDGVSEAEVSQVLHKEVSATRNAFNRFRSTLLDSNSSQHQEFVQSVMAKGGMPEEQKRARIQQCIQALGAWKPRLTFILTIKRHHLRAFDDSNPRAGTKNIPPGTVIDSVVTDARAFDFYLASHQGIKGTTRPTRYLVLTDDHQLSADDVQEFVNDSAHMFQRCTRAVSLPASVYYADVIGHRVRGWLNAGGNNYDGTSTEHSFSGGGMANAASRKQDFEACKLNLESTEIGRNMFRAQGGPPSMWWL